MILNAIWLPVFNGATTGYFIAGLFIIFGLLYTCLHLMLLVSQNKLNLAEFIFLRVGISIYTGWVTAATILNAAFVLINTGMNVDKGFNEEGWSKAILIVAFILYNIVMYLELNPLFGAVYVWVLFSIRSRTLLNIDNMHTNDKIDANLEDRLSSLASFINVLAIIQILSVVACSGYVGSMLKRDGKVAKGLLY